MDSPTKDRAIAELSSRGYVSLSKFARIASISYPTALKLAKAGKIRTVIVGGVNRVYQEEARRFLEEGNAVVKVEEDNSSSTFTYPG